MRDTYNSAGKFLVKVAVVLAAALLAGCAYRGSGTDNPLSRTAVWFSFVDGGDIRAACRPGAPDHFRFVYNGRYREQVRVYEIGATEPRTLDVRVIGSGTVTEITLGNPFGPWNGVAKSASLSPTQYDALVKSMAESGAFQATPGAIELPSDRFYWTAATCHDGAFHLDAWLFPSERFSRITFPQWLLAFDPTGIAFNPPRALVPNDPAEYDSYYGDHGVAEHRPWSITISGDRVEAIPAL